MGIHNYTIHNNCKKKKIYLHLFINKPCLNIPNVKIILGLIYLCCVLEKEI